MSEQGRQARADKEGSILIAGVGNLLLADEGVGVHAARRLMQMTWPFGVKVIDGGTGGFSLLGHVEDFSHVIFIDACEMREPPGTIRVLPLESVQAATDDARMSMHHVSIPDLMHLFKAVDCGACPETRIIAVQPQTIDWTDELSPPVARAMDRIVATVAEIVAQLTGDSWQAPRVHTGLPPDPGSDESVE